MQDTLPQSAFLLSDINAAIVLAVLELGSLLLVSLASLAILAVPLHRFFIEMALESLL
jgi:hypothetical protein